jgi:hypothetical protein
MKSSSSPATTFITARIKACGFGTKCCCVAPRIPLRAGGVHNEIGKAFAKEQSLMKERKGKVLALIPLNLGGYLFKWRMGKPRSAGTARCRLHWPGENHEKFETQVENVIRALRADANAREKPPTPGLRFCL